MGARESTYKFLQTLAEILTRRKGYFSSTAEQALWC